MKGQTIQNPLTKTYGYPVRFNLREQSKVTSVKDQGIAGSCWAHAALASLESSLLPGEYWDFSENHLKNTHGFDWLQGGNIYMSTAYLARWSGPISEADDPYNDTSNISPTGLTPEKHIQEVLFLPERANSLDNDNIKDALVNYGAVTVAYYHSQYNYNATYDAYYYTGGSKANHEVTIVGWDDNFSRYNFNNIPSGDGAFIIKNSWGTAFGESGYMYMSYYTKSLTDFSVFMNAEAINNYSKIYQYDPLGAVIDLGYYSDSIWGANVFTANSDEQLEAVSFYTFSANSNYTVNIYTGVNAYPVSGVLAAAQTGYLPYAGYHTIKLNTPVALSGGTKFSVVVGLTSPGTNYPMAIEMPYYDFSSAAEASPGQSFTSYNGASWEDLTNYPEYAEANVCIKAFTNITPLNSHIKRFSGIDRVETAGLIAKEVYPEQATNVIIAESRKMADSMVGTLLAGALDAPILLADRQTDLNSYSKLKSQIDELSPSNVYLLGSAEVVPEEISSYLTESDYLVTRIAGADRFATAVEVIKAAKQHQNLGEVLYVANGRGFTDANGMMQAAEGYALAPGADVARNFNPVLLVDKNWNTAVKAARVNQLIAEAGLPLINECIILGDMDDVPQAVEDVLTAHFGEKVSRVTGSLYEVAADLALKYAAANSSLDVVLARGDLLADTLAGGILAGKKNAPVVFVETNNIPPAVSNALNTILFSNSTAYIAGGTPAVSDSVAAVVNQMISDKN